MLSFAPWISIGMVWSLSSRFMTLSGPSTVIRAGVTAIFSNR